MRNLRASIFDVKKPLGSKAYAIVLTLVLGVFLTAKEIDRSRCLSAGVITVNDGKKFEEVIKGGGFTHQMKVKAKNLSEAMIKPNVFEKSVADWKRRTCSVGFPGVAALMENMTPAASYYGVWAALSKPAPTFQIAASIPVIWLLLVGNAQRFYDAGKSYWRRLLTLASIVGVGLIGLIKPEPYFAIGLDENLPQIIAGPAVMVISYLLFWIVLAWITIEAVFLESKPIAAPQADMRRNEY